MGKLNYFSKIYIAFVFVILYVPIGYLMFYSFNSGDSMASFESFSFTHYVDLLQDRRLLIIVLNTIIIALLSATIATIIGVFGAIMVMFMHNRQLKQSTLFLNNILIVSPDVIIGASFLLFFTIIGVKLGFTSVLLSHIAFSIPIVVIMIYPKLKDMSPTLIDAAIDLGASRKDVVNRVIIPYIRPSIFASFFLALTYSLDDFAVTFFVTGNGFSTLSVEVYSMARTGVTLTINALSTLLFLVIITFVIGYYMIQKQAKKPFSEVSK